MRIAPGGEFAAEVEPSDLQTIVDQLGELVESLQDKSESPIRFEPINLTVVVEK